MPSQRLSVVVTRRLPEAVETRLAELFQVELNAEDIPLNRDGLLAAMRRAAVLVPTITDKIDAALLAQAGDRLKLIANYGAGVDNIDVHTARQRGVLVSNTPGSSAAGMGRPGSMTAPTIRRPRPPCASPPGFSAGRSNGLDMPAIPRCRRVVRTRHGPCRRARWAARRPRA